MFLDYISNGMQENYTRALNTITKCCIIENVDRITKAKHRSFFVNGRIAMLSTVRKKALLIINPFAGRMRSRKGLFDIIDLFSKSGYEVTVHVTTKKGDAVEFLEKCSCDYSLVMCCGGDGTLNEVVTGMMRLPSVMPIGYIPSGTANDLATSLGLSRNIRKSTQTVLNGRLSGHDIGKFNQDSYFTYIASFGAFTKVSYATKQPFKNAMGYLAYLFEGIRNVGEIRPYKVAVKSDELETDGEFLFGAVMNTTSAGGIFKLDKKLVDFGDGKFEVLLIRNPHNAAELSDVVKSLAKRQFDNKYVTLFKTSRIFFDSEKPLSWTVDGEFGGNNTRVEIINLHRAVQIYRP